MELRIIEKVDADGVKEVYHVDEQGRRQGKYIELYPMEHCHANVTSKTIRNTVEKQNMEKMVK